EVVLSVLELEFTFVGIPYQDDVPAEFDSFGIVIVKDFVYIIPCSIISDTEDKRNTRFDEAAFIFDDVKKCITKDIRVVETNACQYCHNRFEYIRRIVFGTESRFNNDVIDGSETSEIDEHHQRDDFKLGRCTEICLLLHIFTDRPDDFNETHDIVIADR